VLRVCPLIRWSLMRSLGGKIKFPCRVFSGFYMKNKNEVFDPNVNIFDVFEPNQNSVSSQPDFYALSA